MGRGGEGEPAYRMPQVNLKKQATKKDKTYAEVLAYHDDVVRMYETRLLNVRAELTEKIVRRSARIAELEKEMTEKDGVALRRSARIAELRQEIQEKDVYIAGLKRKIAELEAKLETSRPMPRCARCGEAGHNVRTCRVR